MTGQPGDKINLEKSASTFFFFFKDVIKLNSFHLYASEKIHCFPGYKNTAWVNP